MQSKTPFLFSMPPLFAWPLAVTTSIALLLAAALMFGGSAEPSETTAQDTDETTEVTRQASSTEQAVYLGLAHRAGRADPHDGSPQAHEHHAMVHRWRVGVGFLQLVTQMIFVHPLMVLLALVYLRPRPPAAPAPAPDVRSSEAQEAGPVDAPQPDTGLRYACRAAARRAAGGVPASRQVRYDRSLGGEVAERQTRMI